MKRVCIAVVCLLLTLCTAAFAEPLDPYLEDVHALPLQAALHKRVLLATDGAEPADTPRIGAVISPQAPGETTAWTFYVIGREGADYNVVCQLGRAYDGAFITNVRLESDQNMLAYTRLPKGWESSTHVFRFETVMAEGGENYTLYVALYDRDNSNKRYVSSFSTAIPCDPSDPTVESRVAELARQCEEACTTDYQKIVWCHDWLTEHIVYDDDHLYYGPDGALLRGTCVCDGYSYALLMLLNALDIENVRVTGNSHAWNAACVDDIWFHIDATWDDPSDATENHQFFGLDDALTRATGHTFSGSYSDSLDMHYYLQTPYEDGRMIDFWLDSSLMTGTRVRILPSVFALTDPIRLAAATPKLDFTLVTTNAKTIIGTLLADQLKKQGFRVSYTRASNALTGVKGFSMALPNALTEIDSEAFAGCDPVMLKLPARLQTLAEDAFDGCESLLYILIPDGIEIKDTAALESAGATLVGGTAAKYLANLCGLPYIQN